MSQIALTNLERTEALLRLGYNSREAAFLSLAALHGGYFVRRQYCRFISKQVGGTAALLIRKVLSNGHGTSAAGCHNAKVYHLGSRPFYAALGQEDNRNRRTRPPVVIKNKLMGLDYVLDESERQYLATEQEKVSHFTHTLGIDRALLPVKEFRSPTAVEFTARYFVDKYPISIGDDASPVSFSFIDEGVVTASRFDSYLNQYARLFARLDEFELVYVAASETAFPAAEKTFQIFLNGGSRGHFGNHKPPNVPRLLTHFKDRRRYDEGRLDAFDRARLIRLRDDRQAFAGPAFDALYQTWQTAGERALREALAARTSSSKPSRARFRTHLLTYNYDVFGTVSRSNDGS